MEILKDPDIRQLLIAHFLRKDEYTLDSTTIIINELDVCSGLARIDIAVVNGKLHGYEIKSERDNLDRLPSQTDYYNKIFDTMTLVISDAHLTKAREIVPKWWGIDCIVKTRTTNRLKTIRKPRINNGTESLDITQLLWKSELMELLHCHEVTKGLKSKSRYELGQLASRIIEKDSIAQFVRNKLKAREVWKALPLQLQYDDSQQLQPN